jgi:predicted porin
LNRSAQLRLLLLILCEAIVKKTLCAVALISSFPCIALAQSSVQIYGIADVGLEYSRDLFAQGSDWRLQSGQQSTSRLGITGSEDLGNGITASFTLEAGLNLDDGSSQGTLFGREAWAALGSNRFGTLRFGRQQMPLYDAQWAIDPFHVNSTGAMQRVFGSGLYGTDPIYRADNTVQYFTPDIAGFVGQAAVSLGEQAEDSSIRRQASLGLSYTRDRLNARFVYHDGNDVPLGPLGAPPLVTGDFKTWFIGATYDFGVAKAHFAFADSEVERLTTLDQRSWLIGATLPIGVGEVLASYVMNDVRDIDEGKTHQFAIGYTHPLSKRTNLYTAAAYTRNDDAVALRTFTVGENSAIFNFGVRHRF